MGCQNSLYSSAVSLTPAELLQGFTWCFETIVRWWWSLNFFFFPPSPVKFGFKHCMAFLFCSAFKSLNRFVIFVFLHLGSFSESRLEGWLSIPNRANIKRYGWKKQVCCVYLAFPLCACIVLKSVMVCWERCQPLQGNIRFPLIVLSILAVRGGEQ